jgi:DNA repair protein RecO (recombination protein O)
MSVSIEDRGVILSIKRHSESSAIIKILSKHHGLCTGYLKGGLNSKKQKTTYQIANLVEFSWKSKNEDGLGVFKIELIKSNLGKIISNNLSLSIVNAAFSVVVENIMDHDPHEQLYEQIIDLLEGFDGEGQMAASYIKFEIKLLEILGYGIDTSSCALTGSKENLVYVSPKTGRAASKEAGKKYHNKLLTLPSFVVQKDKKEPHEEASKIDLENGLSLTGHFFEKYLIGENKRFYSARSKIRKLINQAEEVDISKVKG